MNEEAYMRKLMEVDLNLQSIQAEVDGIRKYVKECKHRKYMMFGETDDALDTVYQWLTKEKAFVKVTRDRLEWQAEKNGYKLIREGDLQDGRES